MSDDGVLNNSTGGRIIYGYPPNPSVNVGRDFEGYKQILIQTLTDNYTNSAVMDKLTTKRPGYAYGGHIQGSGSGTSDSIPAMLSNGEFVVNANQTKKFRGLLEGINSGAIQHFEVGGAVARAKAWASSEAQRMHMDPTFVNNIFQIESGFAADARSKMGAVGVGQLMPLTALENGITGLRQDIVDWAKLVAATAKEKGITTAKAIGIVGSAPVDPNDPRLDVENNVRASVLLMTKLKKEFGDDMEKVAAAYNAGSGTVKKALGPDGNLDVSRLPSETREYLVKMGSATKSTISNFGDTIAEQFQKMLDKVLEFGDKFAPGLTHSIRNLIGKGGVGTTDSYLADNMITEGYVRPADKPTTTSDLISRATSISDIADKLYQGLAQVGASTGILVDDLKKLSSDGIRRVANAIDNIKTLRSDKSAINDIAVGEQVKTLLESVKPAGAPIMTIQEKFGTATSQSSQIDVLKASLSKYGLPNVDLTRKTDKELSDLASKLSAIDTQQTKLDTERAKPGFISDIAANARQSGIKNAIGGLADELVVAGKSFFDKVNGISATARDLGTKAASSFEAEFTSGLTDVLTGKTKPKDFKSGLWDAWTKTYLDTLSKSFSNSLFQQTSLKTMVPDIFANGAKLVGWERATGTAPANQFKNQELNDLNKLATPKIAGGQAFGGNSAMDTRSLGLDIKDSLLYTTDVQVSTAKDSADKVVTAVNTMSNDIVTVLTGATPYTKAPDQGPLPAMPPPASADVTAAVEPKMEVAATAEKIAVPARNIFQRVGASVTGFFRSIFGKTAIDVKTASGEMKPQVDTATTSLTGSISNAATDLMNALGGLGSMALSAFGGLGGKIAAGVMQLVQQVGGSGGMMGGVSKLFDGIGAGATSAWNGLFGSGVSDSGGMMTLLDFIPKATGGIISGPGSGTSDSIPIAASNGEFIVNAMATAKHRSLLHAINSGKGFAAGGLVGSSFIPPGDGTLSRANVNNSNQSVFNIHVTGDVSRQTRMEIQKMIPQIATGVGMHNRELGTRG
jgi:hypothetical protein